MSDERPCIDCAEPTRNEHGRCRSCDIEYLLDSSQCSSCLQMRYREADTGKDPTEYVAAFVWGGPCRCSPEPPTVYEARMQDRQ